MSTSRRSRRFKPKGNDLLCSVEIKIFNINVLASTVPECIEAFGVSAYVAEFEHCTTDCHW